MSRPTYKRIRSFDDPLPEPSSMSYPLSTTPHLSAFTTTSKSGSGAKIAVGFIFFVWRAGTMCAEMAKSYCSFAELKADVLRLQDVS